MLKASNVMKWMMSRQDEDDCIHILIVGYGMQENLLHFIHIFHNRNGEEIHFFFVVKINAIKLKCDQHENHRLTMKQFDDRNINLPECEYDKILNRGLKE